MAYLLWNCKAIPHVLWSATHSIYIPRKSQRLFRRMLGICFANSVASVGIGRLPRGNLPFLFLFAKQILQRAYYPGSNPGARISGYRLNILSNKTFRLVTTCRHSSAGSSQEFVTKFLLSSQTSFARKQLTCNHTPP